MLKQQITPNEIIIRLTEKLDKYLRALAQLGVETRQSIAFEDQYNGMQSANSARLDVVNLRTGDLINGNVDE